jgi:hypothetical protein
MDQYAQQDAVHRNHENPELQWKAQNSINILEQ